MSGPISAYDIAILWKKQPGNPMFADQYPARAYYAILRTLMHDELTQTGSCELIEQYLISSASARIDVILYASMCDAIDAALRSVPMDSIDPDRLIVGAFVKSWKSFHRPFLNVPVMNLNDEKIGALITAYCRIQEQFRAASSPKAAPVPSAPPSEAPAAPSAAEPSAPSRLQEDVSGKEDAAKKSAAILEEAEQQKVALLAEAERLRDAILEEATHQRTIVLEEAEQQRSTILEDTGKQAAEILQNARDEAANILEDARLRAAEEAEQESARLVQEKMAAYLQQQRRLWEQEQAEQLQANAAAAATAATLKEEACIKTNTVGADMNCMLDSALTQLAALRSGLMTDLQQWRTSLYKAEYGPLINFYNNLTTVAARFERDAAGEQVQPLTGEEELTKLQSHSSGMSMLQRNLLRAMEAMGIRRFSPNPGELFDSYYHSAAESEDDDLFNDRPIAECVTPGLLRVVNAQESAVLLRAVVRVDANNAE